MRKYIQSFNNQLVTPSMLVLKNLPWRNPVLLTKKVIAHFHKDSLYRNSIYLMMSTAVMSFFGFFFWIINTKLFTTDQIGLSTALISSLTLIINFSMIGLNQGLIRFLPKAEKKADMINTVLTTLFISTIVTTCIYLIGLNYFSPKLLFLKENYFLLISFFIISIFCTLDAMTSSIFIAIRDTKYTFYNSLLKSVIKLALPFALVTLGSYAIFISTSIGSVITLFSSLFILRILIKYKFKPSIKKSIFLKIYKLSFGNYIAFIMASLPLTIMPIILNNTLGSAQAAYFYMDMMIISLLNTIQSSVNNSLFAEGSNNDTNLKEHILKSIKFIFLLLIPSILFIIFFGKYILLVFGKEYSSEGITLLRLLSISLVFTSVNGICGAILNVKGKVNLIMAMCFIGPLILLTLIYWAIPHGLVSLGYAWLTGEALISLIYIVLVYYFLKLTPKKLV